jgi:hypothetical protein
MSVRGVHMGLLVSSGNQTQTMMCMAIIIAARNILCCDGRGLGVLLNYSFDPAHASRLPELFQ